MKKEELNQALLNHDFELGNALIKEWGASVRAEMLAANGEKDLRRILDNALSFAEATLYLARVMRAHIATELHANSASFLYRETELEHHRWRMNA